MAKILATRIRSWAGALRWAPSDTFTADLSFDYYDDETNGPPLLTTRVDEFPESATAILGVTSIHSQLVCGI